MKEEYKTNPALFLSKNKIVIIDLNEKYYLIDGQHRYEMLKELFFESNQTLSEFVFITWYKCIVINETIDIFKSLNKDSIKNQNYINQDEFVHIKINDFLNDLKSTHKDAFAKRSSTSGYIKTIEEFTNELATHNFFDNNKSPVQLKIELLKANDEFYRLNNYAVNYEINNRIFYANEKENIKNQIIFPLKNTNFMTWFFNHNINPCHYYKMQKTPIPTYLRKQVWEKYHGNSETAICPISYCQTQINRSAQGSMQIGHIISEKNGGKTVLNNLKPLCKKCNCEMGSINWNIFDPTSS